jgi:acetyl-CoA carboxylase biotin carboxylase subunit
VPPFYDSLLAKLIVHADSRPAALANAAAALARFRAAGVATTLGFHETLLRDPDFQRGDVHTRWVEQTFLPRQLGQAA